MSLIGLHVSPFIIFCMDSDPTQHPQIIIQIIPQLPILRAKFVPPELVE
jgi:hypothetical protein